MIYKITILTNRVAEDMGIAYLYSKVTVLLSERCITGSLPSQAIYTRKLNVNNLQAVVAEI